MPEMSLEEQALRHADEFFTGPENWFRGDVGGPGGSKCLGMAILDALRVNGNPGARFGPDVDKITGIWVTSNWNDNICPSFAALKAKLQERIEYYQKQRLSQSYIVIIGPGRQVRG